MIYKTIKVNAKLHKSIIKIKPTLTKNIRVKANLAVAVRRYSPDIDIYDGEYEVTPKFESIELDTDNKLMTDDFVVKQIPISVTQNLSGGNTVYIGG